MNILRLSTLSLITMMVIPIGAYAHCPNHKHCGPGGIDPDDPTYSVTIIEGEVGGGSNGTPWSRGGGKKTINGKGVLTNVSGFFSALTEDPPFNLDKAIKCFGEDSYEIIAGTIRPAKKGTVQAQFWFEAKTYQGIPPEPDLIPVFYQLHYTGEFTEGSGSVWLPKDGSPGFLTMDHWKLTATNEGEDIKSISCIGEATANVMITVELL